MVDFSQLLRRPAGEAKRPPILPMGDYIGIISGSYTTGKSSQKKTPYIDLPIRLIEWPADASETWSETDEKGQIVEYSKSEIDLGSRSNFYTRFYLTDNSLIRLDDFIRSCGIDPEGKDYIDIMPELVGQQIVASVEKLLNERTNRLFNPQEVRKVTGLAGA